MSLTSQQRQILATLVKQIHQLQKALQQIGLTQTTILQFIVKRIFRAPIEIEHKQKQASLLKQVIDKWLKQAMGKESSLREILLTMLQKVQMEHGLIEQCNYVEQEYSAESKNEDLQVQGRTNDEFKFRYYKKIEYLKEKKEKMQEEGRTNDFMPELNHIKRFEQDLQESIKKTRMLKMIIQKKIMDGMDDDFGNRMNNFNKYLTLESS